jgi:cytochrome c oxidase assembly protein Cox11
MTARSNLSGLSVVELVELFVACALQQDNAKLENDQARTNALVWKLKDIRDELESRPGDQRSALIPLFEHSNPNVQIWAASANLALVPSAARQVLEMLRQTCHGPQQLEAGMRLRALDSGIYKPK